jgi:transposase
MPSSHREYAEWTPDRIVRWAGSTGPNTARAVEHILNRHLHPEQAFRSCMGVISLGKKYGADRLESACARAVSFGCPTYKSLKSILQAKLDTAPLPSSEQDRQIPDHANIRGAGYFQQALALYDTER